MIGPGDLKLAHIVRCDLGQRGKAAAAGVMFERSYDTDESIFEEGQPGAALFLILQGKVAIEICREAGTTRLAVLENGAFFGEMALLDETPRSADARALERTQTLALYRNDLNELVQRDAKTAWPWFCWRTALGDGGDGRSGDCHRDRCIQFWC